jgi:hypothetical protein
LCDSVDEVFLFTGACKDLFDFFDLFDAGFNEADKFPNNPPPIPPMEIKPENMFPKPDCPINPLNLLSSILSLCFDQKCSSGLDSGPVYSVIFTHERERESD